MQDSSIKFNCYNQAFRTFHFTLSHRNIQRNKKNSLKLLRTFAASIMHREKVKAGKFQDQTASKLSTWTESQKCKKSAKKSGSKRLQIITWIGSQKWKIICSILSLESKRQTDQKRERQWHIKIICFCDVLNLNKKLQDTRLGGSSWKCIWSMIS